MEMQTKFYIVKTSAASEFIEGLFDFRAAVRGSIVGPVQCYTGQSESMKVEDGTLVMIDYMPQQAKDLSDYLILNRYRLDIK